MSQWIKGWWYIEIVDYLDNICLPKPSLIFTIAFMYYLLPIVVKSTVVHAGWIHMYVLFTFKVFDRFLFLIKLENERNRVLNLLANVSVHRE